jgi:hypothetical protein
MTQPAVTITELDGQLGVLPPSAGRILALIGTSTSGPIDTPSTFARVKDLMNAFGEGPLVEAAAHEVERYGRPVLVVRTGNSVPGAATAVVFTGTGTSVITVDPLVIPVDDYEVVVSIVTGGTVGTAGITLQYSLDGGRTPSPVVALGVALSYTIPNAGIKLDFAAGDLVAGDVATFTTASPQWNAIELGTALDALALSIVAWEGLEIVGNVVPTSFDTIELKVTGMSALGKNHWWIGNCRIPNVGESEAAYLSAMATAFADRATKHGTVCFGACKVTSSVSGRKYRRPVSFIAAAREQSLSEEQDSALIDLGPLPCAIRDDAGNPDEHDETAFPGADDARFYTLRTWEGYQGVYVNRPRLFSVSGSDFQLVPHRRVMNIARDVLRNYFVRRLNKPVRVNRDTGFILEAEALEIESGATAALRTALTTKPKASEAVFVLSRYDNLLASKTLTGDARVTPLAYPELVEINLGFFNPALQVLAA